MLSIARKTALSGSAARIAQRSILIKPLVISPKKQQIRHQTNGSATAEKVYIYIYIFLRSSRSFRLLNIHTGNHHQTFI